MKYYHTHLVFFTGMQRVQHRLSWLELVKADTEELAVTPAYLCLVSLSEVILHPHNPQDFTVTGKQGKQKSTQVGCAPATRSLVFSGCFTSGEVS